MKKLISILLLLALLAALCGCGSDDGGSPQDSAAEGGSAKIADTLPTVLNTNEYVLYQNIFYNEAGGDYVGKQLTKEGTFATVRDAFNQVTRYYVWGYNDATKCCDWQWEFVPKEGQALPPNGSLVKMTGTFSAGKDALDGYWFTDASLEVETEYHGPDCDIDMSCMSCTLERVQMLNIQYKPEPFEGKTVCAYGRILALGAFQDPYYDGSWTQTYSSDDAPPAIGTMVLVSGTVRSANIDAATVEVTNLY